MTEPNIQSDEQPAQRPAGGLGAMVAPEGVAAILAIALVAGLLTVRLAGLGGTGLAATPKPSDGASPGPTVAGPAVDLVAINTVLGVNQRLLDFGQSLQIEIDKPKVNINNVKAIFSQDMSPQLLAGAPAAARLLGTPATALVGTDLSAIYSQLRTLIDEANDFSRNDEPAYRSSAKAVVEALKALPPIDLRLEALRAGLPDPNAPVAPSVAPSVAPTDSPPPSAPPVTTAPSIQPTAPPTAGSTVPPSGVPSPTSSPPLAEPNQLQNPGFETSIEPWQLVLANPNVNAALALDATSPHGGKTSARIDVIAFDGLPQSISLQQGGVTLEQGANYRVTIALRSTSVRQVRIRVVPATPPDQSFITKTVTVGPTWTMNTFDVSTFVGGTGLVFVIEVGQAGGSVWVDDVSIARVSPFGP